MLRRGKKREGKAKKELPLSSEAEYIPKISLTISNKRRNSSFLEERPNSEQGSSTGQRYNQDSGHLKSTLDMDNGRVLICSVCGENANGQYFGAFVCLPCKSFYIRCTKDGEPVFSPRCHGNCEVTKQSRIRCQSCRFQKCIRAGMCRKEKPERVNPKEGQFLCKVCGDLANGIHFGVFTCEGCKKFFRRGLTENKSYKCKGHNRCVMNPRNRNACRACRYRQCLNVGMSREAIKMGRPKKRDSLSPRLMTISPEQNHDSGDLILMSCNESDNEDVEMVEIPVTKGEVDSRDASSSVDDSPNALLTPTCDRSPGDVSRRNIESSWEERQYFPSSIKGTYSRRIYPLTSTVTSESEYSRFAEKTLSGMPESDRKKFLKTLPGSSFAFPEAGFKDPSLKRENGSQDDSDVFSLYSLSNDDIDTMLRLLGDFEKPKLAPFRRRLQFKGDEIHKQPKRMKFEEFGPGLKNSDIDKRPEDSSKPPITHLTFSPTDDTFDQNHTVVKPVPTTYQECHYGPQADEASVGQYKTTGYSSPAYHSSPALSSRSPAPCNCRCWDKAGGQESTMGALRKLNGIADKTESYQQPQYKQENQSIGEIGRAYEVLYDKVGYSSQPNIGDSTSGASSVESWWNVDIDCRCIRVPGGLCMCENGQGRSGNMNAATYPFVSLSVSKVIGTYS